MRARVFILGLLFAVFFSASLSYSDVPQMINYQGKLTTPQGALIDTIISMTFTIYADSIGGDSLWSETQGGVEVKKGGFSVLLGAMNPLPYVFFEGSVRYLGIKVGSDPEMIPRKQIVSVAYAFHALTADQVLDGDNDWDGAGTGKMYPHHLTDKVGIGTTDPDKYKLYVEGENKGICAVATQGSSAERPFAVEASLNTTNSVTTGGGFAATLNKSTNAPNISYLMGGTFDLDRGASATGSMIGVRVTMANETSADWGLELKVESPAYAIYSPHDGKVYFEGNVGIGTGSPGTNKLKVAGNIDATGFTEGGSNTLSNDISGNAATATNADKVDGYHGGNASGQVAVSNGTKCTDLNADMVDGYHAGSFAQRFRSGLGPGADTTIFSIPHTQPFIVTIAEHHGTPSDNAIGFVHCIENDHYVAWLGYDGQGNQVKGRASLYGITTIVTVRGGGIKLETPGDGTLTLQLVTSSEHSGYFSVR